MITIDELNKSVSVNNANADYVIVDGQIFQLTDGSIYLSNLNTMYDVEVVQVVEENHIPKPEPEIIPDPEIVEQVVIEDIILP